MNPVYLDYAATTPVDPKVAEKMAACLTLDGNFANPASRSHRYGWMAEEAVENARQQIADRIGADVREIVWTSGATEANNLAIKGALEHVGAEGKHIITSAIEHKAVLDTCAYMETQGVEVTYLQPNEEGIVSPQQVKDAIKSNTVLVSVMFVNNELGSINPIKEIAQICQKSQVLLHVDGAQALGKVVVDVSDLGIDLLSLSAHKFYGPKGMGALFVKRGIKVAPQIHGGGHERGMRSGTLATHQIVGMGEAAALINHEEIQHIANLRKSLLDGLASVEGVHVNGQLSQGVPHIINISFAGVDGESLLLSLPQVAVSSGSACNSATMAPSYVLKAIGLSDDLAHASIRFSLGRFTTQEQIQQVVENVTTAVKRLKGMAA
ncbi:IscS subfamily cysteine desulfurase [Bermanella sp. R86510]|uniref:IscS subfamily cysteine desulfurase n=1 Tax=unclassified Bermanella TaxID=2627862 RepID=UPI0037CC5265